MVYGKFCQDMRDRREKLGMSCAEVGVVVGVSRSTVWKWENGSALPRTVGVFDGWCGVLGVSGVGIEVVKKGRKG